MTRRYLVGTLLVTGLALCVAYLSPGLAAAAPADVSPRAIADTWGNARVVPGTAAPNTGLDAAVQAVSCAAPGSCGAGGYYADRAGHVYGFVDVEVGGTWQLAREVPGLAAFGKGSSEVFAVSCGAPGNCVAVGSTLARRGGLDAFAASYSNGHWHNAVKVRGVITLGSHPGIGSLSVSCPSAGNCAVGGSYADRAGHVQAFVAREVHGTWRKAVEVPGTASLNKGGYAQVNSVSCTAAGNCAVVGSYEDGARVFRAFVADLAGGSWRRARQMPGTRTSRLGADVTAVSCALRGNCSAGGYIGSTFSGPAQAIVVSEVNGIWRPAIVVPGTVALNRLQLASVATVSCSSPGNCSAGGSYFSAPNNYQAFVVNEVKGAWRKAIEVPGTAALNGGGGAEVTSLSCASPGYCSAGGYYDSGKPLAFVVSEVHGTWRNAIEVPGISALGTQAEILSVSCAKPGKCAAAGDFSKAIIGQQAMVVDQH